MSDETKQTEASSCRSKLTFVCDLPMHALEVNILDSTDEVVECLQSVARAMTDAAIRTSYRYSAFGQRSA